jgi:SAM-dependent methyltransferase
VDGENYTAGYRLYYLPGIWIFQNYLFSCYSHDFLPAYEMDSRDDISEKKTRGSPCTTGKIIIMTHTDHVALIKNGIDRRGGVWADLGSGEGAFTLALREIGGEDIEIYSIDKYAPSLEVQREKFDAQFPESNIHYLHRDFTEDLPLPQLDGILMANALHFLKSQEKFVRNLRRYLKPQGKLILVEYNFSEGNPWVPYPLPFEKFVILAESTGLSGPELLHTVPSRFMNEIYSAAARNS